MFPFPAEMLLCQAEINVSLERGGCSDSCRLSSEPFPPQQKSQELVDKAVFCDTTEVLFWGGAFFFFCSIRVRFYLNILSTLSFKLVMCFFLSCLGGGSCFNCLYVNVEELGACFHPSALETETKAKQTCRWLQILDPSHCPMLLSLPACVICCLQNTVLGVWVWTLPSRWTLPLSAAAGGGGRCSRVLGQEQSLRGPQPLARAPRQRRKDWLGSSPGL